MGRRILVVDDAEDIRMALSALYEHLGYTVRCCSEGNEALDVMNEGWRPDLILLDLMMPGMNGWEFLERIEDGSELDGISIVVMSAFSSKGKIESRWVRELVTKPVKINKLREIADRYAG